MKGLVGWWEQSKPVVDGFKTCPIQLRVFSQKFAIAGVSHYDSRAGTDVSAVSGPRSKSLIYSLV